MAADPTDKELDALQVLARSDSPPAERKLAFEIFGEILLEYGYVERHGDDARITGLGFDKLMVTGR